jgi:hypothetical protein
MSYQDPKPFGTFFTGEDFDDDHVNKMLESLRTFAEINWLSFTKFGSLGVADDCSDIEFADRTLVTNEDLAHYTIITANAYLGYPADEFKIFVATGLGDTGNSVIGAYQSNETECLRVAVKPRTGPFIVGLRQFTGNTDGYIQGTLAAVPVFTLQTRAGLGADEICQALVYDSVNDVFLASWSDMGSTATLERNLGGVASWTSVSYGSSVPIRSLATGLGKTIGLLGGSNSQIVYSANGSTFSLVSLPVPVQCSTPPFPVLAGDYGKRLTAYDKVEDVWYIVSDDLSVGLVILSSPSASSAWTQLASATNPLAGSTAYVLMSLVVESGIIGLYAYSTVVPSIATWFVSRDFGQSWRMVTSQRFSGANAQPFTKLAGGRLCLSQENSGLYSSSPMFVYP